MWKVALLSTLALAGCNCDRDALYEALGKEAALQLRSPSTAVFEPAESAVKLFIDDSSACYISASGYVDSQNGFGAIVRSNFMGTAKDEGGEIVVRHALIIPL